MVDFRKAVMLLTEAVRINNGKEAVNLIKNKQIGVKIHPSYNTANLDELIPSFDILISKVGASNAAFAVQLAVNKIPAFKVKGMFKSRVNDYGDDAFITLISNRNKAWVKQIPGFMDAITLNNKVPFEESKWKSVADKIDEQAGSHGKATKGSGNSNEVKELYNDGTWTLQVPTSWEGEKAASFYGKRGEKQTPCNWCTRADKKYYDMYSQNSPLYIIRNHESGKTYQIAFDKLNVHFLDQNDQKGDEVTKGDLNGIPDKLLSKIKWNGRTLADYKKEYNRTEMKKGELKNPTPDFKYAEWEAPRDEGDGVVSQVMKNLYNSENKDSLNTFMINGKSFKFNKRNNYAKKYYYKNKPNFVIISVLSRNGNIKDGILWTYKIENGEFIKVSNIDFINYIEDSGKLFHKVAEEQKEAYYKRMNRESNKNEYKNKDKAFVNRMADILTKNVDRQFKKDGLISGDMSVESSIALIAKNVGRGNESSGNFLPLKINLYILENGISGKEAVGKIELSVDNMKCDISEYDGLELNKETKEAIIKSTESALKSYAKEAVKDKYGINKRIDFRGRAKGVVTYDTEARRKLQFESYLS